MDNKIYGHKSSNEQGQGRQLQYRHLMQAPCLGGETHVSTEPSTEGECPWEGASRELRSGEMTAVRATATQGDDEQVSGRGVTRPLSDWTRDTWDTQSPHVSVSSSVKQE